MAERVVMPKLGLTMEEGTVLQWLRREGEQVTKGEPILEVEGDKTTSEVESPADGVLLRTVVCENETVPVGDVVGLVGAAGESTELDKPDLSIKKDARRSGTDDGRREQKKPSRDEARVFISPRARALAERQGIDWTTLRGSDAETGRIQERDIQEAIAARDELSRPERESGFGGSGGGVKYPFSSRRATMVRRLRKSVDEALHIYLWSELDATELVRIRKEYNEMRPESPVTAGAMFVMATSRALIEHPELNAHVAGDCVRLCNSVDIGVAVGLEDGVVVPVIRDAARRGLGEISDEGKRLASAARNGQLAANELAGGTFTVSNLGRSGVRAFTAIINSPQAAILSVGAIEERPSVVDGEICVRSKVVLGLGADHRAVDGVHGAAFLTTLKRFVETPGWMVETKDV